MTRVFSVLLKKDATESVGGDTSALTCSNITYVQTRLYRIQGRPEFMRRLKVHFNLFADRAKNRDFTIEK